MVVIRSLMVVFDPSPCALSQAGCEPGGEKKENQDSFIAISDVSGDARGRAPSVPWGEARDTYGARRAIPERTCAIIIRRTHRREYPCSRHEESTRHGTARWAPPCCVGLNPMQLAVFLVPSTGTANSDISFRNSAETSSRAA